MLVAYVKRLQSASCAKTDLRVVHNYLPTALVNCRNSIGHGDHTTPCDWLRQDDGVAFVATTDQPLRARRTGPRWPPGGMIGFSATNAPPTVAPNRWPDSDAGHQPSLLPSPPVGNRPRPRSGNDGRHAELFSTRTNKALTLAGLSTSRAPDHRCAGCAKRPEAYRGRSATNRAVRIRCGIDEWLGYGTHFCSGGGAAPRTSEPFAALTSRVHGSAELAIMDTAIRDQERRMAVSDLRPGRRVRDQGEAPDRRHSDPRGSGKGVPCAGARVGHSFPGTITSTRGVVVKTRTSYGAWRVRVRQDNVTEM
jgi:hypothetical protein